MQRYSALYPFMMDELLPAPAAPGASQGYKTDTEKEG